MSDETKPSPQPEDTETEALFVEFIQPPQSLRRAVVPGPSGLNDSDAIEKADEALSGLSMHFEEWMQNDLQSLNAAVARICDDNFSEEAFDELYRASHDLRGDGQTFGFAQASDVANSFCNYLDATRIIGQTPKAVIEKFSQAIFAISKPGASTKDMQIGEILAEALRVLASEQQKKADAKIVEARKETAA